MRDLIRSELDCVSGGDWSVELDAGFVKVVVEGNESVQDMAVATATIANDAYWGARGAVADFYEWVGNSWNYAMACSYQYY